MNTKPIKCFKCAVGVENKVPNIVLKLLDELLKAGIDYDGSDIEINGKVIIDLSNEDFVKLTNIIGEFKILMEFVNRKYSLIMENVTMLNNVFEYMKDYNKDRVLIEGK
jgi:outer membrane protein OmpA-like peptidoglycan-associated protein